MKKNLLYLLAFVTLAFASCDPLKDTYNEIKPAPYSKDLVLALSTVYASVDLANTEISKTLNSTYPQLGNGSKAIVTYNSSVTQFTPVDSLLSATASTPTLYTVTDADYTVINGNNFKNFSAAKVIQFLDTKFTTKVENQLIVLNYVYFESGVTTSAGVAVSETFIYLKGAWTKAYQVSQAQYISAGKLTVFNFAAADEPNLVSFFNTFLKSDASVSAKAKTGDLKYVSFAYFASNKTYQRIKVLVFDGANWGVKPIVSAPLSFLKKNDKWIPDPTVYYVLVSNDYTAIADNAPATIGTTANRANLKQYKNFNLAANQPTTNWTNADVEAAIIYLLGTKFPNAPVDPTVEYKITYAAYKPPIGTDEKSFVKTATGFIIAPKAD